VVGVICTRWVYGTCKHYVFAVEFQGAVTAANQMSGEF